MLEWNGGSRNDSLSTWYVSDAAILSYDVLPYFLCVYILEYIKTYINLLFLFKVHSLNQVGLLSWRLMIFLGDYYVCFGFFHVNWKFHGLVTFWTYTSALLAYSRINMSTIIQRLKFCDMCPYNGKGQ